VLAILLAAAALTSQPPAVDVADRAAPREVASAFAPRRPQLVPPPWREMVAASPSSLDAYARPGPLDRAQSNFNHNVAGLLVLLTAVGALLDRTGRFPAARHWPVGFLALAAFLLAIAEPNGWPLGPEPFFASLRAPSVLVHRLATLLVGALALLEWRVRTDPRPRRGRLAFPLLCGLGGVLLLTHSHSVFAARWAFLTELTHDAIGLLAVLMAIDRWLEVRPGGGRRGWGWAMGMALVGLVLLFYREA
jgi:putative copper resistance protein D